MSGRLGRCFVGATVSGIAQLLPERDAANSVNNSSHNLSVAFLD